MVACKWGVHPEAFPLLYDEEGDWWGMPGAVLMTANRSISSLPARKVFTKAISSSISTVSSKSLVPIPVIGTKGFFDCMKLAQAGYHAVGLLSSSLSEVQEDLLVSNFGQLVLLFDGDDTGKG